MRRASGQWRNSKKQRNEVQKWQTNPNGKNWEMNVTAKCKSYDIKKLGKHGVQNLHQKSKTKYFK